MVLNPIKIPSKNIYAKDNQKVLKNYIDTIEVDKKAPQIISDTQNVYNESVTGVFTPSVPQDAVSRNSRVSTTAFGYLFNIAYIEETPKYVTKTFIIPQRIGNMRIYEILTGKDANNQANIKYSLVGYISNGIANGKVTITGSDGFGNVAYKDLIVEEPTNIKTSYEKGYSITSAETDTEYTSLYNYGAYNVNTTATFSLSNESNILTATVTSTSDGKNFTITLKILCGLKINKLKGHAVVMTDEVPYTFTLNGEYEQYDPTKVIVNFYGDTISLDLQDNTLTINDGEYRYAFSGNELMQDSNRPTVRETYSNIITHYKNGKEVAEIKCNIDDYYDTHTNLAISKDGKDNLPMTFHIGDTVIPYVYTANGEDRPMSYYFDNTPKQFVVVGKGISYRGRVYQNLTLQEIIREEAKKIYPIAIIEVGAELRAGGDYAYYELYLKEGTLKIGDIIKYRGEEGVITDFEDGNFEGAVLRNGAIANASGQFISVVVID